MRERNDTQQDESLALLRAARWMSDLHGLWRYCGKSACRRIGACRGDAKRCLHALPLVPIEAREFIIGLHEAQEDGMSFDEAFAMLEGEWEALQRWRTHCRASLFSPPHDGAADTSS